MSDELRAAEALARLQRTLRDSMEVKANVETTALSVDGREVTTLFSVDCLDSVGDITSTHAFESVLSAKAEFIPHLWMHDVMTPAIAVIRKFEKLSRAQLPDDVQAGYPHATGGMACISSYLDDPHADRIFQGIKKGVPYQASFGYAVKRHRPHKSIKAADGKPARVIEDLHLYEVSTTQPNHAAQPATRVILNKALAVIEELKAGWRHGKHEDIESLNQAVETLNQMIALFVSMGATNAQLIDAARPALEPERTSTVDALLAEVSSIYEVANVSLRSPTQV